MASWFILAASLTILATHRFIATFLLLLATTIALFTGVLSWQAILLFVAITVIGVIGWRFQYHVWVKVISEVTLVICAVGLLIHFFPGFHNLKYLDSVIVGEQSRPFTMYFNFDKALVPFVLLFCLPSLFSAQAPKTAKPWQWWLLIIAVPMLLVVAAIAGGLGFEWHLPTWLPAFIICNLLFVSLAEEALFRGYLQQRLTQWFGSPYLALVVCALVFGAVHFAGGPLLILFATLAGIIYGLAWMWSGKLWLAVSFHFGLNLLHLLFFTYPVKMVAG
ncbi:lysostaphin resistance A-like protein [Providencia stuartii]|uniref:CPBP family intramembrane glutamic endopeptidase n=1 Tax=Providencia stuartii TaxID=588 RepID=UPI000C9BF603|nr:CPBP family intramembrane glutamic endopeptidase [Providencia stuartii]SUC45951.1 CAAX amino terminal protease self- immunity [Providencia stuartii]HEM8214067.1 CPBP family intramembrane metalloprotease [Providencia stuartii]